MKPGLKSTELWFSIISFCVGSILAAIGAEGGISQIVGGICMALAPTSYVAGRSAVKSKEAIGQAQVAAAREIAKKKD